MRRGDLTRRAGVRGTKLPSLTWRNKLSTDTGIATNTQDAARRALGLFLRRMRDRATPTTAGAGPRRGARRTPGMRREEVALAAGISVTWYTWLEQGRPMKVSPETLTAVADALRLDETERVHLRRLADSSATDSPHASGRTRALMPEVRALVDGLVPHPAYAMNGWWDVLHANAPAVTLFGDFGAYPGTTDNVLRRLFLDATWRERFPMWSVVAESAVAQFRATSGFYVGNLEWEEFVARLASESSDFEELWARHAFAGAVATSCDVRAADGSRSTFSYASVAPDTERCDVRVVIYARAG